MNLLQSAKAWLDAQHEALFPLLVVFALWLGQYAVRRWLPGVWEAAANVPLGIGLDRLDKGMRKAWQAIPSAIGGAVLLSMSTGGGLTDAIVGALLGVLAPVMHEALKALPMVPYRGATAQPEPDDVDRTLS